MKLERQLAPFHSKKMGVEPGSKSLDLNVVDVVAPNSHSSNDKRGLDPSPHDLEPAARNTMPKLEFYDSMIDLKNQYEAHVKEVYYQGNTYHLVKEICVDERVVIKPKLMFEENVEDNAHNCVPSLVFGSKEMPKNNAGNKGFNLPAVEESEQVSANHDRRNEVIHKDEDVGEENLIGNTRKEMDLPEDTHDSIPSGVKAEQFSSEAEYHSKFKGPKRILDEGVLAGPALGLAVEELNSDGTKSLSYHFEPSALGDFGKKDCHHLGVCNCNVTHHTFRPLEGHYLHGESSQIRNSLGEASFSAMAPVSGRISYSGSIPYSGSMSIRSDSSTTSARSFAFPILQSEYLSSPARMKKPGNKYCFWKQSFWKDRFLCCKF